jgi:erythromycin esterase-like protein
VGAASHGTAEFHRWRAELTKRLVAERGFDLVGVDGDWADCHRLHCCVAGAPGVPKDPAAVLWGLRRWPRWLWANEEVVEFAAWLREFNARRRRPVGFHGLDVHGVRRTRPVSLPGVAPAFSAWQNAEAPAGERLADTLDQLAGAYGPGAKAVVWAHNTHVGATEESLGRLVRERHGAADTVLVGFGTYAGSVLAADRWAGEPRRVPVPPAAPGSVESRWHEAMPGVDSMAVFPRGGGPEWAGEVRAHRSIGVVYGEDYAPVALRPRYDAFVHCDWSTALTPLHRMEIMTRSAGRQG